MKILVLDRYPEEALSPLKKIPGAEIIQQQNPTPTTEHLSSVEAMLIRSRTLINIELLRKTPQLKVVVTATSGFNHIDVQECKRRDIKVFYTPEANAQSAAEMTILLMLNCLRRIPQVISVNQQNLWKDHLSAGEELSGKMIGLIGFGRVGKKVAKLAQAFEADVQFYDPYVDFETASQTGTQKTDLTQLLKTSDIVSLHVPLTPITKNLMHANNLAEMSSEAYLINASRGEVVSEIALIQALASGQLAGAGLDVFEREPLAAESKLRSLPNVFITPHIGALTEQALQKASFFAVNKLLDYLQTKNADDALPNGVPWFT